MSSPAVIGYTDMLHVRAGGRLSVHVSAPEGAFETRLVRLSSGPDVAETIGAAFAGSYPAAEWPLAPGSYMTVAQGVPCPADPHLAVWVWPTRPADSRDQAILCWGPAHGLFLDGAGRVVLRWGGFTLSAAPLPSRRWSRIELCRHGDRLVLDILTRDGGERRTGVGGVLPMGGLGATTWPFCLAAIAGEGSVSGCFDGKIARPEIRDSGRVLAQWALGRNPPDRTVVDLGPDGRHGLLVNRPQKGMTGPDWCGDSTGWREAPEDYDAIAFHSDDLSDAGWPTAFTFEVPADLPSDAYGIELRSGGGRDVLPVFVTPRPDAARAPLAFIVPTFSYLAYANERHWWSNPAIKDITGKTLDEIVGAHDRYGARHRLISCYDYHSDGSGNAHASTRRPLVNMRADYVHPLLRGPHQLSGDILTIEWLRSIGQPFDILTDHCLHEHGIAALRPYRAVMTGSHPEYVSREVYDAVEAYAQDGGRIIHMGGNAYYFVVSLFPDEPHIMEARRGIAGTVPWQSEPGELRQAATGELCGLWRWRGRSVHRLFGAGTAAVSFGPGRPYEATEARTDPRYAWIFEGIEGARIDARSVLLGGAAGFEFDAMRHDLGTPVDTVKLATAGDFGALAFMPGEDVLTTGQHGSLTTDMLYRDLPGGGRLFAAPSVAWTGALQDNGGNNDVARITRNVLRKFLET